MKKGSWIVILTATVEKEIVCEGCTEKQAYENPFDYAVNEVETSQSDYEVKRVMPNE